MQRRRIEGDGAERLAQIGVMRDLPIGRRRELARLADELTAQEGETIMRQGEPGYEFMMLERGRAEVLEDGEPIDVLGPGDCFGELAVLSDGQPRTASVVASGEVHAIVLSAHFMRELHDLLPDVGERIDRVAAERAARNELRR